MARLMDAVLLGRIMKIAKAIATVLLWAIMIGQAMPMTLMPETFDPWYMPYTTVWFLISAFIFYPATALVALVLRQPAHGVAHWAANVAYAAVLTWLIWKTKSRRRNRRDVITGEQNKTLEDSVANAPHPQS
jgi:hypothetical protein